MPIYEYECDACGFIHEIMQKISDPPVETCPKCSGKMHKRISQCTFHLKGTGWYVTDYANKSSSSSHSGKSDSSKNGSGSSSKDSKE